MPIPWRGYEPGSAAALAAARAYQAPAGVIEDVGEVARPAGWYSGQETEETVIGNGISQIEFVKPEVVIPPRQYLPQPVAFNGQGPLPGIETDGVAINGLGGVEATPMGLPLVVGAAAMLSLGFLKRFFIRYGAKALKLLIGVAAFKEFMDMLGIGAPDETMIRIRKGARRRYSIGSNPRVGTLQKVSRHCQRLLKRHEKVIREFLPKKAPRYGIPPSRALSPIEKAAIRG